MAGGEMSFADLGKWWLFAPAALHSDRTPRVESAAPGRIER